MDSTHNSFHYKYEIPDRKIRDLFTIGSECWYHLGILSAIPVVQSYRNYHALTFHDFCGMPLWHIFEDCYDIKETEYSYQDEGIFLHHELIAKWIKLTKKDDMQESFSSDFIYAKRVDSNAAVIIKDIEINNTIVFEAGEIYDAPYCSFSVSFEELPVFNRLFGSLNLSRDYFIEQILLTEEKYLEAATLRKQVESLKSALRSQIQTKRSGIDNTWKKPLSHYNKDVDRTLTKREREIVACIKTGMTNKEISNKLFISIDTTKRHISNIFRKTHSRNRVELLNKVTIEKK